MLKYYYIQASDSKKSTVPSKISPGSQGHGGNNEAGGRWWRASFLWVKRRPRECSSLNGVRTAIAKERKSIIFLVINIYSFMYRFIHLLIYLSIILPIHLYYLFFIYIYYPFIYHTSYLSIYLLFYLFTYSFLLLWVMFSCSYIRWIYRLVWPLSIRRGVVLIASPLLTLVVLLVGNGIITVIDIYLFLISRTKR